jgi:hypothetical protein
MLYFEAISKNNVTGRKRFINIKWRAWDLYIGIVVIRSDCHQNVTKFILKDLKG